MSRPLRIYHGPTNIVGMPARLARMQRARGAKARCVVWHENPFVHDADVNHALERRSRPMRALVMLGHFVAALWRYDLFHFYAGQTLLPLNLDLPVLRLLGKRLVMTYCGTDIRLREVERARNPYYSLVLASSEGRRSDASKRRLLRWQGLWLHRLTAPRNLRAHAEAALPRPKIVHDIWINQISAVPDDQPLPRAPGNPPVIVHAPSDPGIKGTEHVEAALETLRARGVAFEYVLLRDVDTAEVRRILREQADVVVDQLYLGGFGSLAVESMHYGLPVCAYLVDDVLRDAPDCPIVNATPHNLADVLQDLLADPARRAELGERGRAFVRARCAPGVLEDRVWQLYMQILGG